ncbi:transglycosylase domain-containing protein [Streptomyces agglomeratus]|uniref:Transglycosylase domain-containing protein n=1 Tax=Streptomyces agglomeratus TaxID=285458 RepID=A0A1E5PAE6_9ACTN|nr:transglycosylase family protein [Streptomyces agglomeratus]OEJ26536.1 transglycosylase domain-containing protein [Streptomyces agglomeratus]OEJ39397.1 transglycosylase domain-containing protein [Streptomyces agglomeratus]OEJ46220.1 transglycosylase domain-containing protein [Streptomyces agglomeratus]OEJ51918.1 transglycosylase domain-containing protein [Streptomyces agglomeratus]OEJ59321.1 transglycosylase domain-containing protein [Streptomyces agglomeratus]
MRSGNGRHRRPRQAPALVVAAGVAGSAIAIPLLGASGASAAEATTWDRVADCESGGMWSADLGNGYYGGLQFSPETWQKFGGTAYAPRADLASRSQQIQVAEKVLAEQGPQAWPSCALISGLTEGDDAASADGASAGTDAEPKADTSDAAPEGSQSPEPAAPKADASAGAGKKGSGSAKTAEPATPPASEASKGSGAPGTSEEPGGASKSPAPPATQEGAPKGKHRGEEAPESFDAVPGVSGIERESGRHASRGDGSTRDPADTKAAVGAKDGSYTVRDGDSLSAIADAHDLSGGWTALYAANEKTVGSDPDLILPGQSLDLG